MMIGKRISNRYKILESIGGGGMANVYLAHDIILDRDVAVKILRIDLADESNLIRRFQREAQSATSLVHPNIVGVYDVGEENDLHYIVMEYVEGMDLKQYIHEHYPIPYEKTVDIMLQILSAVKVAHQHQIIHRDLKPQNILIDKQGNVKITDFGIAMALSETSITQTNSLLGSVHYLSPEQARGGMATQKSDIYALGIVLYEMIMGKVPFDGESAVSIAIKHLQTTVPSVKEQNPDIPQSIDNIILRSTAKDPFLRYQSIEEMEKDLRTALDPERKNEAPFVFKEDNEVTKTIPIIPANIMQNIEDTKVSEPEAAKTPPKKPKKKKNRKKVFWITFIVILLFAALIGVLWYLGKQPTTVEVPNVSNQTESSAISNLEAQGFNVNKTIEKNSDKIEEGKIISTDPKAGKKVEKGSRINLYISVGSKKITLEDYTGKSYDTVKKTLDEQGFRSVSSQEAYSDEQDKGMIISQNPLANQDVVAKDTDISFVVSKGPEPVLLANLSGFTKKAAEDYAKTNQLEISSSEEYSDSVPEGQVISQKPSAGTSMAKGDNISVVISKGEKEKQVKTVSKDFTIPYKEEDNSDDEADDDQPKQEHVQIFIEDKNHTYSSVFRELDITKDTSVTINFDIEEGSKAKYRIVREKETVDEGTVDYPE
ncbi:Serine/threonine-protein kinase PrkC [Listeria grayi]|uniref:Serine/threonine-protein kinase PrkC n=1 Tax=Listeria grayi FSL F6-1183 TaxID=1265827 RepID=A0A829R480_LISGR|nr:Stk1 family PASTA domain-containing Ser/Thr kinase [Listeria grayi]EUJ27016.1 protein kinase [Listeria grayi FSL F6-1183]VEI33159.1 Serine/threonine-protein kinase PrkC [Listeria grayi]